MRRSRMTTIFLLPLILPLVALSQPARAQSFEELQLVPVKGTADDWELRDQEGKLLGSIKNLKNETSRIYNAAGAYNGFVYRSGEWVPPEARQKRELQLAYENVRLYIAIITAAELASPESREIEAIKKEGAEGEWELRDPGGSAAGILVKAEVSFKFYDAGNNFMGYINPSGNWLPKLGVNRREMRITPDEAQFYLDVVEAIRKSIG